MDNGQILQLLRFGEFPSPCENASLVETHISWVILCNKYAYKIKKPIKYDFLDFSTLSLRKRYCLRELELNQRLTKGIYLDVKAIRNDGSSLGIDKLNGHVIDYCLRMKKMDGHLRMDRLLAREKVTKSQIKSLAKMLAAFHKTTEIIPFSNYDNLVQNFVAIKSEIPFLKKYLEKTYIDMLENSLFQSQKYLAINEKFIKSRWLNGFVRDCHGDLHSRNIFLCDEPVVFDCIEFNDAFRYIDVLNEVAFFCMDLEKFKANKLGVHFMHHYLKETNWSFGEKERSLFNFFKAYRANVRTKVNSLRARGIADLNANHSVLKEAESYIKIMHAHLKLLSVDA